MEKAYQLSEKIIAEVDEFAQNYTSYDGNTITSEDSVNDLNVIIQDGFVLYNYMVEKKLYEGKDEITSTLNELQKYIEKLTITKENAEKLHLSNVMQIWNQAKLVIAILACQILDFRDSLN